MELRSLDGNGQRLDGGCMFGNCPRSLWRRWFEPDDENRVGLACRSLLVCEDGGRKVLLEAGVGLSLPPQLRARYGVKGQSHRLLEGLRGLGLEPDEIDVVVLSHLHFDHAGGLLTPWVEGRAPDLIFPRARFLVSSAAWKRASRPHRRDRASFLPEVCEQLSRSGRLLLLEKEATRNPVLGDAYQLSYSQGHTPGLLVTRVESSRGPVTFVSDCVPGVAWLRLPITMGYDRCPELLVDEKQRLLERIHAEKGWLFFTHDPSVAACRLRRDSGDELTPADPMAEVRW